MTTPDRNGSPFDDVTGWSLAAASNYVTKGKPAAADLSRGPVFYRGCYRLGAPTSPLSAATPARGGEPAELVVADKYHNGGPVTFLRDFYADWLVPHTEGGGEPLAPALADFLDVFNHGTLRLYPQVAADYPPPAAADPLAGLLRGLLGALFTVPAPYDPRVFHFVEYARPTRPLAALADVLADHFDLPVRASVGPGRWVPLTEEEAAVLRVPAVYETGVRIVLGPAGWRDRIRHFHPRCGSAFCLLARLVGEYLGEHRWFDVELLLGAADSGPDPDDPAADDLDWTFWMQGAGYRSGLISADVCMAAAYPGGATP